MAQALSGGCLCGRIRYEIATDPILMLNCHCRDCQRSSGGAYAPVLVVPKPEVRFQGEPRYYRTVGVSGKAVERGFCSNCGSQVVLKLERMPDVLGLQAASLDDPSRFKPSADIFTDSAQPWDHLNVGTKKMPQGY